MNLSPYLETMKNLPNRFSNLAFWRGVRKLKDELVKTFEYVGEWGNGVESGLSGISENVNELKGEITDVNNVIFYDALFFQPYNNADGETNNPVIIDKVIPRRTLIKSIKFKASTNGYNPTIAFLDENNKIIYLDKKEETQVKGETYFFNINKKFDVDVYALISSPYYKFNSDEGSQTEYWSTQVYPFMTQGVVGWTVPVEKNSDKISYSIEIITLEPTKNKINNTKLIVDKNGYGNFTSINSALSYAYSVESKQNPITIIINPGVYEEIVCIEGKHYVSLVGINRNDCIIINETAMYDNAPLRICGQCYIANLSFIATANKYKTPPWLGNRSGKDGWKQDILSGIVYPEWLQSIGSYAVHCDDDVTGDETTARFENCYMYSETYPAFGSGMRPNNKIELINCEIVTNFDSDVYSYGLSHNQGITQGALLIHGGENIDGKTNECVVKDCVIKTNIGKVLTMYPVWTNTNADITFINNSFMSESLSPDSVYYDFRFENKMINPISHGNNLNFLNKENLS